MDDPGALALFRAAVLSDDELQDQLQGIDDVDAFAAAAAALASARGLSIVPHALRLALRDDPLGISRFSDAPLTPYRPQQQWLPVEIASGGGGPFVDWAHFGAGGPAESFFEESIRKALRRPINRLCRHRTALGELAGTAASSESIRPSGFIFHMSRCGSTLVSQMLARDPRAIVLSEAPPLDAIVRSRVMSAPVNDDGHAALLEAAIRVFGRKRAPCHDRYFIKLDSWHILDLPLFHKRFPDVPWVFLFREPAEVLASQVIQRGIQTVPEYIPPSVFGLSAEDAASPDYCALVLRQVCRAALSHFHLGRGLLVNYSRLPQALWTDILPHFGIPWDSGDVERFRQAAQMDPKARVPFAGDSAEKRAALTPELVSVAKTFIGPVYAQLSRLEMSRRA